MNLNHFSILMMVGFFGIFDVSATLSATPSTAPNKADQANDILGSKEDLPLEINADNDIVYDHKNNTCVATGNVKTFYGDYALDCDVLTAFFRKDAAGKNELWQVKAEGHVVMHSLKEHQIAYGDHGLYELDRDYVTLTGGDLKLIVDDLIVTARDSLEYAKAKNIAYAKGNAVAEKVDRLVKGDILTAFFVRNAQGKQEIERIEAHKDVVISTPSEYATGDEGTYRKADEFATLEGHVKITKPTEQIEGNYAEVLLDTGKSKVLKQKPAVSGDKTAGSTTAPSQRVQVLILPRAKKAI
ncbi:MAG: LptA/OstA family protein [Janthinobacterium lividum]